MKVVSGAYQFVLPTAYFPKFDRVDGDLDCLFNLRFSIKSQEPICNISHPPNCEVLEESKTSVVIQ